MNRIIREARLTDMTEILKVMDAAKKIMRQSGNMHQWVDGYPSEDVIMTDMEKNGGFVVEDDGKVVGYFAFLPSPEPTYANIYEGEWLDDEQPYHVIHRIASYPDAHGIFSAIMDFCLCHEPYIRIDTHRDNTIMQHNIMKHGFTYCGIIYLANGDERLAFQKKHQRDKQI
ncbi:MAG: N-acetyltransferase [Prevotella sp.]|nr:N-acetyltransferase [Prevotella sp.]